jgi:hypothetical protein
MNFLKIVFITGLITCLGVFIYDRYVKNTENYGKNGFMVAGGCLIISLDADDQGLENAAKFLENLKNKDKSFTLPGVE